MVLNLTVTPKQKKFMDSRADETLFGGAAGGGKSRGQLVDALLYGLRYPGSRQLMLRRTYPDLERSLVQEHLKFFPLKVYRYNSSTHRGMLKNGSVLEFGYCDKENDVYRYQGAEYDVVRFDELTHFTYNQYIYLMSRVRGVMPFPRGIKSSTNPGGVGHAWVKERFIDPAPAGQMFKAGKRTRLFIPSLVQDNPFLMQGDPEYVQRLEMLPEEQRKALLLGDWDIFSGQVFEEWRNDPTHYKDGAWTHVIEPFEIPSWWKIWRGFDFGYSKPFSVGWYAADGDGKVYRIKEWYGCTKEPNTGLKLTPQEIAEGIREREENDPMLRGRQIIGVADPAIFEESRGESIAQMMVRPPNMVYWQPGDHKRLPGLMQCHYRLAFDKNGQCMFQVFNTCRGFIRTVPMLVYSETRPEDIDTDMEDHIYDEWRYVMMASPISPRPNVKRSVPEEDPLDLYKEQQTGTKVLRI